MQTFERDGARIRYAVHGSGFPVLALAPGGMKSRAQAWEKVPWNPVAALAGTHRVIVMDQRHAGGSTAPVTGDEGWATYAADQLALLDHLGVDRFHVVGMCIGGPFLLNLIRSAPDRVERAVALQPIGLDDNRALFYELFDGWAVDRVGAHPEAGPAEWAAFREGLFGVEPTLFTVPDAELSAITTPLLVLMGDDPHHPSSASRLLAERVPGARLVPRWTEGADLAAATATIAEFLG
ncbi:alpha/beta fold hydrolase [Pseudonocardia humida]|uniref:Alpha/beta fold hydrolase n=1 Tax=Pseudonocardia humida TaxID=2800819 RepID=A0ABT0ZXD2_9PSEU|nr:alpha/beta hydrolase [Pseudonocardia humida]MCO1655412.1 alpha/beta fold hydrolase [Pseudonocardia humida]